MDQSQVKCISKNEECQDNKNIEHLRMGGACMSPSAILSPSCAKYKFIVNK